MTGLTDKVEDLRVFIDKIMSAHRGAHGKEPKLFVDMEGVNLGRQGSVSIMQILLVHREEQTICLIDVHTLQKKAFDTIGPNSAASLKDVLENPRITKALFDVRNDSDALFSHYGVRIQGVHDIQLMECMTRPVYQRRYVNGLKRCLADLPSAQREETDKIKDAGLRLFVPDLGGRYEVFNERPMAQVLIDYCAQDIIVLLQLWRTYAGKLSPRDWSRLTKAVKGRIALSQSPTYNGKGPHKCLSGL